MSIHPLLFSSRSEDTHSYASSLCYVHVDYGAGLFLGLIDRDVRSFHPSMPSSQRVQMMGRSRAHEQQQAEGLIKVCLPTVL